MNIIMDKGIQFRGYHDSYSNFNIDREVNKKVILTEEQFNHFKDYLLKESLSIADDVIHATSMVLNKIQNLINEKKASGSFQFDLFGEVFTIVWKSNSDATNCANVNLKDKILFISFIFSQDNMMLWNIADSIQHEIEHIYQWVKKPSHEMLSPRRGKVYDKVVELFSHYSEDTIQHNVLEAIYISYPEEQDAFVNGLYSVISKSKNRFQVSMIISDSPINKLKRNLIQINYNLYNNDKFIESKELNEILEILNRDLKWLRKTLNKGINRLARKMAHVEKKVIEDLNNHS